jgi:hypothetical protein
LAQLFLGCGEEHVERKDAHFMVAGKEREKQSEREREREDKGREAGAKTYPLRHASQ